MTPVEKVVTGRKWNNPEIFAEIRRDGIYMTISLEDFMIALGEEMGSPLWWLTKDALKKKLSASCEKVLSEVRTVSKEIV